ncbi:ciliary microtubule inner protein 1 isoform X1 [Equus przewalskii]|uniref:Ciliary microtubule inner protein 1 isoform X1 n=1 Tax=Equus przewalskii TaxID=9798 RepID=A0ABM4LZ68_EQUPR
MKCAHLAASVSPPSLGGGRPLGARSVRWRKYRLKAETEARQNWAQKWGFLTTPLEELIKGEEADPTPQPKIELPQRFCIRPVTPVEKYIKVLPSPPVPKTTQGFIGWRSGVPGLNKCLEHDYEIRSCKGAYAKELSWPKQGIH